MPGLIEALGGGTGDPQKDAAINQGILQMGLQMLQSKGSFGQALGQGGMAGIQGYNQRQDNDFQMQQRAQQQKQWEEQNRQMAQQQKLRDLAPQYQRSAASNAMANGQGPTLDNAQNMATAKPSFDWDGYISAVEGVDPMRALELRQATAKDNTPISVAKGTTLLDRKTMKPVFSSPDAESTDPLTKLITARNALPEGHPDRPAYDAAIRKATTHQPGTSVSVNTGQKGFDNTLKLRGDFRSEPIYKAHQEVQSAYSQIQQSLKQASPAGDLAGATKLMKILDPGSVVRESELGMAMAASGALDRIQHYATNILNGTKLTPTQRKDFQNLADALYGESVKQYNSKRGEYEGIAKRNELNGVDVVGESAAAPQSRVVNFGDLK